MAWTTPGTAVAGEVLEAAFWNEQVRDNSDYLKTETDSLTADRAFVFIKSQSFSSAASVAVTDAFSASYSAYEIVFTSLSGSTAAGLTAQMRSGASTESSSNYRIQQLTSTSTTVSSARQAASSGWNLFGLYSTLNSGASFIRVLKPFEAQRTSYINYSLYQGGASIETYQSVGDLATSTSYDGLTLTPNSGTISGKISIYGLR
jgi:hypothetical protein